MTNDEMHGALVKWLSGLLGVKVIKDHQGGKQPALPYVMVNFTGSAEVRRHAQKIVYEDADTGDMDTGDVFPAVTATPIIEMEWRSCHRSFIQSGTLRICDISCTLS